MKQEISYAIKKRISEKSTIKKKLFLNILYYDEDNVIRFLILSETDYGYGSLFYDSIAAGYLNSVPNGKESLIQPDVFDKFYYECPLEDFKKLILLVVE